VGDLGTRPSKHFVAARSLSREAGFEAVPIIYQEEKRMEPGKRAYQQALVAELVFPDLDLLWALTEEPTPWRSRVLAFRGPEVAAERTELLRAEPR
jgi:hypothetical protein